jgi:hypothetical protein
VFLLNLLLALQDFKNLVSFNCYIGGFSSINWFDIVFDLGFLVNNLF